MYRIIAKAHLIIGLVWLVLLLFKVLNYKRYKLRTMTAEAEHFLAVKQRSVWTQEIIIKKLS